MSASIPASFSPFRCVYRGETSTLNAARTGVADWLESQGGASLLQDVTLVVSELVSNAIEASPACDYVVDANVSAGMVSLTVTNETTSPIPGSDSWGPVEALAAQGRGLAIVSALCDQVVVSEHQGRTSVTVKLAFDHPSADQSAL
jgi:anti-sigma regulatory factor (Ser/Thr protein kinase)